MKPSNKLQANSPQRIEQIVTLAKMHEQELIAITCPKCDGALAGIVRKCEHSANDWCAYCENQGIVYLGTNDPRPTYNQEKVMHALNAVLYLAERDLGTTFPGEVGFRGPVVPMPIPLRGALEFGFENTHCFRTRDNYTDLPVLANAISLLEEITAFCRKMYASHAEWQAEGPTLLISTADARDDAELLIGSTMIGGA